MPVIGQISVGDGATFTPSVDANGVLSWTNNKNLTNPANYDIGAAVQTEVAAQVPGEVSSQIATKVPATTGDTDTPVYVNGSGVITSTGKAFSDYLPLAGGTMTGNISGNVSSFRFYNSSPNNDGDTRIMSTAQVADGANIYLAGKSNSTAGRFSITATNGTDSAELRGLPDGTLTWGGNDITPQKSSESTTSSDVSSTNNTVTNLLDFRLTKGTWLVQGIAAFVSNATGWRRLGIGTSASSLFKDRFSLVTCPAVNGDLTRMSLTTIISVASTTTFYLNAQQNSGNTLGIGAGVRLFRLSSVN